jgi:hypothetical protein
MMAQIRSSKILNNKYFVTFSSKFFPISIFWAGIRIQGFVVVLKLRARETTFVCTYCKQSNISAAVAFYIAFNIH